MVKLCVFNQFSSTMVCKRMKCAKCGLKRKRMVAASDICDHILCVVCYTSMVISSNSYCRRLDIDFYVICDLCVNALKLSEEEGKP